jgi:hypothetical protein
MTHCANGCRNDYGAISVVSGMLQLSTQVHHVLDETYLEPWQLDSNAVHHEAALGTLISHRQWTTTSSSVT